jgi:hypothetical protein
MRPVNHMNVTPGPTKMRRRATSHGGAAVEFALVLPIFLAVLFAIVDYGWFFYQRFTLAAAIRDGLHYGASVPKCSPPICLVASDPWTVANNQALADLALPGSPITPGNVVWGATHYSGVSPDEFVTMKGTMPFVPLVGFVRLPAQMTFRMTMLMEIQE